MSMSLGLSLDKSYIQGRVNWNNGIFKDDQLLDRSTLSELSRNVGITGSVEMKIKSFITDFKEPANLKIEAIIHGNGQWGLGIKGDFKW